MTNTRPTDESITRMMARQHGYDHCVYNSGRWAEGEAFFQLYNEEDVDVRDERCTILKGESKYIWGDPRDDDQAAMILMFDLVTEFDCHIWSDGNQWVIESDFGESRMEWSEYLPISGEEFRYALVSLVIKVTAEV